LASCCLSGCNGFPAICHDFGYAENMVAASVFTAVSILRGYTVCRLFNALRDQLP